MYEFSGRIRLRDSDEVRATAAKAAAMCRDIEFVFDGVEDEPGLVDLAISGCGQFAAGDVLIFDELIESLGPHSVKPAIFTFVYDYDLAGQMAVGSSADVSRAVLSEYALEEIIMPALGDLTKEDAERLIVRLQAAIGGGDGG